MTMPYHDEELRVRLQLGEDSGWEFKAVQFQGDRPASRQRTAWADEIVAFANASGGNLLLGVHDDGSVQGLTRPQLDAVERMVAEICRDTIAPEISPLLYRVSLDGLALLLVEIPVGHAQHERDGRSHVRVGSSKRLMTPDDRLRLAQRRGQARFRGVDEQPVPGTGFGTLSERLWKPLLSAESLLDPKRGLQKLGLLAFNEQGTLCATVAGVLFCTEAPEEFLPQAAITAVRYRGLDEASGQIDAQVIGGPLDLQIRHALAFAIRNMRVAARKDPGRIDLPEYSERAVFEAIVNAVAHRDYSIRGSRIRLRIFVDRMEIRSPGSLPNSLTVESMAERQATRNELVTSLLGRLSASGIEAARDRQFLVERRGDGVPIIWRETRALTGRAPRARLVDDSEFCLTLPAAVLDAGPSQVLITARSQGVPVGGADVLTLYPDGTWGRGSTNAEGKAWIDLHSTSLPMKVFIARTGSAAHVESDWIPAERNLSVELSSLSDGGSVILPDTTGHIPGLFGVINPILDSLDRTYLFASNIDINDGQSQPVSFIPGSEELRLTDARGNTMIVRIIAIEGRSSLIEYQPA